MATKVRLKPRTRSFFQVSHMVMGFKHFQVSNVCQGVEALGESFIAFLADQQSSISNQHPYGMKVLQVADLLRKPQYWTQYNTFLKNETEPAGEMPVLELRNGCDWVSPTAAASAFHNGPWNTSHCKHHFTMTEQTGVRTNHGKKRRLCLIKLLTDV